MSDDSKPEAELQHVDTAEEQVEKIKQVMHDFHLALDLRENGGTAGWKALLDIQKILDMPWVQGAEQTRRRTGK